MSNETGQGQHGVDWALVDERIPAGSNPEDKAARDALFKQLDVNSNKSLSLAECQAALPALLENREAFRKKHETADGLIPGIRDLKPAVKLAFRAARDLVPTGSKPASPGARDIASDDSVDRREFHGLLVYFRHYLELLVIFKEIDSSEDLKLSRDECIAAIPTLERWGIPREQVEYKFPQGSTQKYISFEAFADWASRSKLESVTFDLVEGEVGDTQIAVPRAAAAGRGKVNWPAIDERIPTNPDLDSKAKRDALFKKMDVTNAGALGMTAVNSGLTLLLQHDPATGRKNTEVLIPGITDFRPAIKAAFMASRSLAPPSTGKKKKSADDNVDRREFHALLVYFRHYLELQVLFQEIDTSEDAMVSREEALKALPLLLTWGIEKSDIEERFTKKSKGGARQELKFPLFAEWCLQRKMCEYQFDDMDPEPQGNDAGTVVSPQLGESTGFRDRVAEEAVGNVMQAVQKGKDDEMKSNLDGPLYGAEEDGPLYGAQEEDGPLYGAQEEPLKAPGIQASADNQQNVGSSSSPSAKKRQRPVDPLSPSGGGQSLSGSLKRERSTRSLPAEMSRTFCSSYGHSPVAQGGGLGRSPFLTSLSHVRSLPKITFSERGPESFPGRANSNPGPGSYNLTEPSRTSKYRMQPVSSVPHGTRFGFAENPAKKKPAPGEYGLPKNPVHNTARKVGFSQAPRCRANAVRADGPGPGAYEIKKLDGGRAFTQKGRSPHEYAPLKALPGPGNYDPKETETSKYGRQPKVGFGTSAREDFVAKHQKPAPGPGMYDIDQYTLMGRNSAKFSIMSRRRDPVNFNTYVTPAPGWYDNHATSFGY